MIENTRLIIGGMHCAACSSRIERVVGKKEGIEKIQVNLANGIAEVVHDQELISIDDIHQAISSLGFTSQILEKPEELFEKRRKETGEELKRKYHSFIGMVVFALPLFVISMGDMAGLPIPEFVSREANPVNFVMVQLLLVLPVMWLGRRFYLNGMPALLRKSPNMDSLIALGTGSAFVYSLWNTVLVVAGIDVRQHVVDIYYESTGVLITLVSLGKYFETRSRSTMSNAIGELIGLRPDRVVKLVENRQQEVPVEEVVAGDILLIKPGERVAVDGVIVTGESMVDESMLTGESVPALKGAGDRIFSGTFNTDGALTVRTEESGQFTMLAKIIDLVQKAQGAKPPIANLADKVSFYFVPSVMVIALLSGLMWYFVGEATFSVSLKYFIAVMVIACPCAMGLATPTSIMVGTARGARLGILVKNVDALQRAEKLDVICLDKTGTITEGNLEVTDVIPVDQSENRDTVLKYGASLEASSEHPLAKAVLKEASRADIDIIVPDKFRGVPGKGVAADFGDCRFFLGNKEFLLENDVDLAALEGRDQQLFADGKTVVYLAKNKILIGIIGIADKMRENAPEVMKELKGMGISSVMLTGDNERTAAAIAGKTMVDKFIARLLPAEKAEKITRLQANDHVVAMTGDGINDAPALAAADVGIAMGEGIDVAVESGDVVLVNGNLSSIVTTVNLSREIMKNIRQNLFWAFAFNVICIPVAAGGLAIFGGPSLNPMLAGGAMAMSSVFVVSNALRLNRFNG